MATRFRLTSNTTTPSVSPPLFGFGHANETRRNLLTSSDSSALTTTAQTPDASDHLVFSSTGHVQFTSAPLGAQTFTSGDAFKAAIQCLEAHANNNLSLNITIRICSNDGTTILATLKSFAALGTELATSLTNRFISSTLGSTYTTSDGDRLVIDIAVSGTPSSGGGVQGHNASLRWGCNGSSGDLPENSTETGTTFNPWFEFANTIVFSGAGATEDPFPYFGGSYYPTEG